MPVPPKPIPAHIKQYIIDNFNDGKDTEVDAEPYKPNLHRESGGFAFKTHTKKQHCHVTSDTLIVDLGKEYETAPKYADHVVRKAEERKVDERKADEPKAPTKS